MFNQSGNGPLTTPIKKETLVYYPSTVWGTTKTLTSDLITGDLVLQAGYGILTNGHRIYCNNLTLLGNSYIACDGIGGSDYHGAAGGIAGSLGGGIAGIDGSLAGSTIIPPVNATVGQIGGAGGQGGDASHTNGTSGISASFNIGSVNINFGTDNNGQISLQPLLFNSGLVSGRSTVANQALIFPISGGSGGGGGGSAVIPDPIQYTNGGGGGGGGGVVFIACTGIISIMGGSIIRAIGGNGANGTTIAGNVGGGGGGGGGGGIIVSCNAMSLDPTGSTGLTAHGGDRGTAGTGGFADPQDGDYGNIIISTPNGVQVFQSDVFGNTYPTF